MEDGCSPGKRKRFSYDAAFKLKVIKFAEENGGNRAAGRHFTISEKVVRDWRNKKSELLEMPKTKKARRFAVSPHAEMEKDLYKWVTELRQSGLIVTMWSIRMKALDLYKINSYGNTLVFKASVGWCVRFMRRHNLALRQRTHIAQKLPKDVSDKVINFHKFVIDERKNFAYSLQCIGNMDEIHKLV